MEEECMVGGRLSGVGWCNVHATFCDLIKVVSSTVKITINVMLEIRVMTTY